MCLSLPDFGAKKWLEVNLPSRGRSNIFPQGVKVPFSQTLHFLGKQSIPRERESQFQANIFPLRDNSSNFPLAPKDVWRRGNKGKQWNKDDCSQKHAPGFVLYCGRPEYFGAFSVGVTYSDTWGLHSMNREKSWRRAFPWFSDVKSP